MQVPAVDSTASIPPEGDYSGASYVFSHGRLASFGPASLHVDASGGASGQIPHEGWTGAGLFFGTFADDATVHDASLLATGVIGQEPAPPYSFDGTTLTLRLDNLALMPGTCFAVLHRVTPRAPVRPSGLSPTRRSSSYPR
jgi:hypothetical protein